MRLGSLFTGIGGLDLGLEDAGMRTVWQVEKDDYCTKVLEERWPDVRRYRDVKEVHGAGVCDVPDSHLPGSQKRHKGQPGRQAYTSSERGHLEAVDIIAGGFPCQTVSLAGLRQGVKDPRWLWPEFSRILREVRPQWALIENVTGLLSNAKGETFEGVLKDLAEGGYDAEWDCIPSAAVGALHLRYRVFLVACKVGNPEIESVRARLQPDESLIFGGRKPEHTGWWNVEPNVGRVAPGVPKRVDRIRVLGNAVMPQVASWIGSRILSAQNQLSGRLEAV